ncbi:MAG: hypothetical protein JRI97_12980 [Deltaproteobacteria bacterium]|nr:hypothetical protein [Deltaproteobacteria bacterium]
MSQEESSVQEPAEIQWFKERLKISPRYQDRHDGIFGISWGHFFAMVIMGLAILSVLAAEWMRHRRTKRIVEKLLAEEREGKTDDDEG